MSEPVKFRVHCEACGARIDVTDLAPFTRIECPGCGANFRVKTAFGPYRLTRRHAIGGMSMVFAAHDATLDREVALKILNEEYSANERRIADFEQEARITASLSHPNVVRVFKTGRAFGRFYIAMEMVPGGHLEEHIRELGKIPEAEMLPIAIEVALGLQAAHNAGLIHRDVKPGNILLDASGHARLVDFGLALVTQGGKALASEIWATPYYVPPETIDGQAEDFRSDIYAFGSSLYHALSGKPPCGEHTMSTDALREAKKKIVPLSKVEPSISAATCRLVEKAMSHDPAGRHASYQQLLAELRKARTLLQTVGKSPALDLPATARGSGGGWPKWALAAAIALPVLLAIAFWPRQKPIPPPMPVMPPAPSTGTAKPSTPPATPPDASAEIARVHREARAAFASGDYSEAARALAKLFHNDRVLEPTRSWAAIESVLCAFLAGRADEARRFARDARSHFDALPQDHPLAGGEWSACLKAVDDFPPLPCPPSVDSASGLAAAMLAGLKNWEQGLLDEAAPCFRAATTARLGKDEQWSAVYQHIAGDYLADHRALTDPAFRDEPADLAACEAALARLDELAPTLKTRGRARFNLEAWQHDLRLRALDFARAAATVPAPTSKPPDRDISAALREHIAEWQFDEAVGLLENLDGEPPGIPRQAMLDVLRSAAGFTRDLARDLALRPYQESLKLKSGQTIARLAIAGESLVATTAGGGEIRCQWTDLAADSLIELHRTLVKSSSSETDRLRRHENAIAFDWLVGNRERALAAAAKLAETNPGFRLRWQSVLAGESE
ncbi:MAG: serine/threonine-protein kinase [Luteolibacter sp.]